MQCIGIDAAERLSLEGEKRRIRVRALGRTLADTCRAIRLREQGYPDRYYIPRADVAMDHLIPSETRTHCPFKGQATYYSARVGQDTIPDAAWSYDTPRDSVVAIGGYLAFDGQQVAVETDPA